MSKYIDKEKILNDFSKKEKYFLERRNLFEKNSNGWENWDYCVSIIKELKLNIESNCYDIEITKPLEYSVTAQQIKQEFKEQSRTWLDDEYIDLKNEFISNEVEEILIESNKNNIEFLEEVVEMIIDE